MGAYGEEPLLCGRKGVGCHPRVKDTGRALIGFDKCFREPITTCRAE